MHVPKICLPDVVDSVMFKLFRESPSDCRDEEDEALLEDSDDGRAGFPVFPVSAFKRSFSAFNISISFYLKRNQHKNTGGYSFSKLLGVAILVLAVCMQELTGLRLPQQHVVLYITSMTWSVKTGLPSLLK